MTTVRHVGTSGRAIRVLLVGPSLDILGGQAVQLRRLLGRLESTPGIDVAFLPVNPRLPGPARVFQRVKYLRTISTSFAYVVNLLRVVPSYDIVHAFAASYYSYMLAPLPALIVAKLFGKRTVLNYRSGQADDHLTNWRRTAVPTMRRFANAVVVPSRYLVDVFERHGLRARAIFNFVDLEALPYRPRDVLRPVFLSNRNFEPLYNIRCTLDAFAIIQREFSAASLTLAGDGPQRAALEAHVRDLGLRNVTFAGRVPPALMGGYYDAADVYLNSPNIDNMPGSVIEAYAAGLPIVTSDAGGIPYIVRNEENGLMVPCNDAPALAAAALRLLREPGLARRLSCNGRAECLRHYTWPSVAAEWQALYADLTRSAVSS